MHRGAIADTLACIASIEEHAPAVPVVVFPGDDATAGMVLGERLARAHHRRAVPAAAGNGTAVAANRALEAALANAPELEHVLLLDSGARLRPGAIAALRACAARHGRAAIIGARIVRPDGTVWFANGRFPRLSMSRFHCAAPGGATEHEAAFVPHVGMLIEAAILRRGLRFDTAFPACGGDVDLGRRVQELGRSLWITQAATIEYAGASDCAAIAHQGQHARAKVLLAKKHYRPLRRALFFANAVLVAPWLLLARRRSLRLLVGYVRGLCAGIRTRVGTGSPPVS